MKNIVKQCLFGGALVSAGVCSPAIAGHVTWTGGDAETSVPGFGIDSTVTTGSFWTATTAAPADFAYASGDTSGAFLFTESDIAYGTFSISTMSGASFTVDADTTFLIEWSADGFSSISIDFTGLGITNPALSGVTGADSFELIFLAHETYTMDVSLFSSAGSASFRMTEGTISVVPLPPAAFAGLGMLAGIGAYRRVRR